MIEDIDYLLENSEKDSMVLYVDSTLRNKMYYPSANEYTIQFSQPFRHVYGFEVVDGTIPNTMYNVDNYNKYIYISSVVKNPTSLIPIDAQLMFTQLHTSKTFEYLFNQDEESYIVVGSKVNLLSYVMNRNESALNVKYHVLYKTSLTTSSIVKYKYQSEMHNFIFQYKKIIPNGKTQHKSIKHRHVKTLLNKGYEWF